MKSILALSAVWVILLITSVASAAPGTSGLDVEAGVTVLPFAGDGYYLKVGWQLPHVQWQVVGALHRNRVYRVDDTNNNSSPNLPFDKLQYREFAFDLGAERSLCYRSGALCLRLGAVLSGARTGDADIGIVGAPSYRLTYARLIGRAVLDAGWSQVRVRLGLNIGPGYGWRSDGVSGYSGDAYLNLALAARF